MSKRENLLDGINNFPLSIKKRLDCSDIDMLNIYRIWNNLWYNFLNEKTSDTVYLYEILNNEKLFNKLIYLLQINGYIESVTDGMGYTVTKMLEEKLYKWLTKEEITNIKYKYKFNHYLLKANYSNTIDLVKINNSITVTGLVRKGFTKASNYRFYYDTKYIIKYQKEIAEEILKGLQTSSKSITYNEIVRELVDYYGKDKSQYYTLNRNISDSRGRSIFQCSKKIFNPVSHKTARASLILPNAVQLDNSALDNVYAFIAELNGYRGKNYKDKVNKGKEYADNNVKPDIELMRLSHNYDNLPELIWLERIYENLNNINNWLVPIEIDALASAIQMIGLLTNNRYYLEQTNILNKTFGDIWILGGLTREHVKRAITPILYGSSKAPTDIWIKRKLPYTQEQVNLINKALYSGVFREARIFKDFIIENVKPKEKMEIKIWNDRFIIYCNRFKESVSIPKTYNILMKNYKIKQITRLIEKVPDLEQFKRYFVTLLIHNIDSQIADYICQYSDWIIPNHDSFTTSPTEVDNIRQLYLKEIKDVYINRKEILNDYFHSIGIEKEYENNNIERININEFSPYCLK